MKVNRTELLQCLEMTQMGLSPKNLIEQSACFAFKNSRVMTFNEDVACRIKSPLPKDFHGAVLGSKLLQVIRSIKEEEIDLEIQDDKLRVGAKRSGADISFQKEILLPFNEIDPPGEWKELHTDFTEAVKMVESCAESNKESKLRFIHVHPIYIEACDNFQMARYQIETGLENSVFIKRDDLKSAVNLGLTSFSDTSGWLHVRSPKGAIISLKKWDEDYPDYSEHFDFKGQEVSLPKSLGDAASFAEIFAQENKDDPQVEVIIRKGKVRVIGRGVTGEAWKGSKINYDGPNIGFMIDPQLLISIVEKHQSCEILGEKLRAEGRCWKYATVLGSSGSNGSE